MFGVNGAGAPMSVISYLVELDRTVGVVRRGDSLQLNHLTTDFKPLKFSFQVSLVWNSHDVVCYTMLA